ncbi:MAG TPA: hypothetical protein VGR78_19140, partial [Verrucomicrobiae bacterium]|nr:hypothetical protein [Verrucomicrobiae bacterium]
PLRGQPFAQMSVTFSRAGRRLAARGADGTIRIWETRDWQQVALLRHSETNNLTQLTFGPEDRYLVAASESFCKNFTSAAPMIPRRIAGQMCE